MRITGVRTFHVLPRWLVVAVDTDEGLTGYGEATLEGQSRVVEAALRQLGEHLAGEDPRRVVHHWQVMYRGAFYRGGPAWTSAISGLEQAMWDLKGKRLGVPVHELLGGAVRDRVRMYRHCNVVEGGDLAAGGDVVDVDADLVALARAITASGFTAIKTGIEAPVPALATPGYVQRQADRVARLREAVGPDVDVAVDFHGRTSPATAIRLVEAMAASEPMFVEEPCLPEDVGALAQVARATTVPIATGERRMTSYQFRDLLEARAVAVVQPDLCHVGGVFEARKVAAMAEAQYVSLAPHNPLGPVSLAACLQLAACTPNFLVQELVGLDDGSDLGVGLVRTPFEVVDGHVAVPTEPGLGVDVDEEALAARAYDGAWATPLLVAPDGAHADW